MVALVRGDRCPSDAARQRLIAVARHVRGAVGASSAAQQRAQGSLLSQPLSGGGGTFRSILIANRGEIAIRVARAAADLGIRAVAVYSEDDAQSLHARAADAAQPLAGAGVAAYLDVEGLISAARAADCDAVHPGYGFLSENAAFARRCAEEGLTFVGPPAAMLELFGDKTAARTAAEAVGVPVMKGIDRAVSLEEARGFLSSLGPGRGMMIKALAGGGGRGSRAVRSLEDLDAAYERCRSEAAAAFGNGDVYVEELLSPARHIEVQVLADSRGGVVDLGERECSVQRRFQKLVELAPAAHLAPDLRRSIIDAALRLARHVGYSNVGTFEFLVEGSGGRRFAFIEANARLQVEHTVTEEVTGVDICCSQIRLAAGASLSDLGLDAPGVGLPRGRAIQARVNLETLQADGTVVPAGGVLSAYGPPGGRGVRVDGFGYTGYATSPSFDSLLAKVIVHTSSQDLGAAAARASRALGEFRIGGVATNIPFLQTLLHHPAFLAGEMHTRFVDENAAELVRLADERALSQLARSEEPATDQVPAGTVVDAPHDPLAVFTYGQAGKPLAKPATAPPATPAAPSAPVRGPPGCVAVPVMMQGRLVRLAVGVGDQVRKGQLLAVVEAMKMEHDVKADVGGTVRQIPVPVGKVIQAGFPLLFLQETEQQDHAADEEEDIDLDLIRSDLAQLLERRAYTLDENRPKAVERRRKTGQRTARENVEDLCDSGAFVEYGGLVLARQRRRRTTQWLLENSPADGLITGLGTVNGHLFDAERARVMVMAYDYTVFAGTQGSSNHYKKDRMLRLAAQLRLPVCLFSEGGGGRPGDTEGLHSIGMDCPTFMEMGKLSGLVPLVGINSGYCFAGNTCLLACCDVIIATENSTIAMGGPAMIEGGGLGIYKPQDVGPMSFQVPNGVVDILVADEAAAVAAAKKYLSYFQGPVAEWTAPDQRRLRHIVPESRVKMYDMRQLIRTLCDEGSVLELREQFAVGIITALGRIEGVPMGIIANNPSHLAGAIDSPGSDKAARFLQLCDAFDLPVLSLMDCPGMMVGPEVEQTALVRHCARLFNMGSNLQVPMFGLVIRKAYGLGVQAMCGGSSMFPAAIVAWPTGEFAGMNIDGAIKLAYRREIEAISDAEERRKFYQKMVDAGYEAARAVNSAQMFGIDDVIDPAESRRWITAGLRSLPPDCRPAGWMHRKGKKRSCIDTW